MKPYIQTIITLPIKKPQPIAAVQNHRTPAMANATEIDTIDFEPDDDDLMEEETAVEIDASSPRVSSHIPKLKSAITGGLGLGVGKKTKGRGFREETDEDRNNRMSGRFDSLDSDGGPGPEQCQFYFSLVNFVNLFGFGVDLKCMLN